MVDDFYGRITARSIEMQGRYDEHQAAQRLAFDGNIPCPFCDAGNRKFVVKHGDVLVVENDFPYEVYDGRDVEKHLMIVPLRHISSFKDFTKQESGDYWRTMAEYHAKGYSSMTRSAIDEKRSVPEHLHTHLFFYFTNNR